MLSLESLNRLHFSDGRIRPEFRKKLLAQHLRNQVLGRKDWCDLLLLGANNLLISTKIYQ
jgi:hypothetical protein